MKKVLSGLLISSFSFCSSALLFAQSGASSTPIQTAKPDASENSQFEPAPQVPVVDAQPSSSGSQASAMFKEERERLLKVLATEIEPNLPRADIEKLNRSVMRLGSYRKDWVEKG